MILLVLVLSDDGGVCVVRGVMRCQDIILLIIPVFHKYLIQHNNEKCKTVSSLMHANSLLPRVGFYYPSIQQLTKTMKKRLLEIL